MGSVVFANPILQRILQRVRWQKPNTLAMNQSVSAARTAQPASSLACLPDTAIQTIFQQLLNTPIPALNLAQTCRACASEFATQRSTFIEQHRHSLRPETIFSDPYNSLPASVTLSWPSFAIMKRLCTMPSEKAANTWESLFEDITLQAVSRGYHLKQGTVHSHELPAQSQVDIPIYMNHDMITKLPTCCAEYFWSSAKAGLQKVLAKQQLPVTFSLIECIERPIWLNC